VRLPTPYGTLGIRCEHTVWPPPPPAARPGSQQAPVVRATPLNACVCWRTTARALLQLFTHNTLPHTVHTLHFLHAHPLPSHTRTWPHSPTRTHISPFLVLRLQHLQDICRHLTLPSMTPLPPAGPQSDGGRKGRKSLQCQYHRAHLQRYPPTPTHALPQAPSRFFPGLRKENTPTQHFIVLMQHSSLGDFSYTENCPTYLGWRPAFTSLACSALFISFLVQLPLPAVLYDAVPVQPDVELNVGPHSHNPSFTCGLEDIHAAHGSSFASVGPPGKDNQSGR